jgi:hypothetical protein
MTNMFHSAPVNMFMACLCKKFYIPDAHQLVMVVPLQTHTAAVIVLMMVGN